MSRRRRSTPELETFLPASIALAADVAAEQVLDEDYLLRRYGVKPPNGRTR